MSDGMMPPQKQFSEPSLSLSDLEFAASCEMTREREDAIERLHGCILESLSLIRHFGGEDEDDQRWISRVENELSETLQETVSMTSGARKRGDPHFSVEEEARFLAKGAFGLRNLMGM